MTSARAPETLLIPGHNDSDAELEAMCAWLSEHLGTDVPLHFTAFHPDWKMLDAAPTPAASLRRARQIALRHGLRYVYTGNVRDPEGGSTWCHSCGAGLIGRFGYDLQHWGLTPDGRCARCGTAFRSALLLQDTYQISAEFCVGLAYAAEARQPKTQHRPAWPRR